MKRTKERLTGGLIVLLGAALDLTTKYILKGALFGATEPFCGFRLRLVKNTGISFSLLTGNPGLLLLATGVLLVALAAYLWFWPPKARAARLGLCLALAGGVGNFVDRLVNGCVTDFIEPLFVQFAVFNVADILVVGGAFLAAISLILTEGRRSA